MIGINLQLNILYTDCVNASSVNMSKNKVDISQDGNLVK